MHGHHILEYLSYFNLMLQGYQFLFCNSSTKPNILGRYYFVHSLPQDLYFCYDKTMPPFLLYDHFLLIKIKSCLGYNMSLDDACHFEKRLFHASFATVCFHLFCFFIYFSVYSTTGTLIYDGCANMIQFNFTVTYYSLRVLCFRFLFYLSFLCIEQLTYSPI